MALGVLLAVPAALRTCEGGEWEVREIGRSVEGRPIRAHSLGEGPVVLLLAGVHGDEPQGAECARAVLREGGRLSHGLDGWQVVVIECLNPDGMKRGTRGNAHGVDLNRNMPARNWSAEGEGRYEPGPEPGSEPETQALLALLEESPPGRIISLHAPLGVVNWDGPDDGAAGLLHEATGWPLASDIGYPTPGSLGSWAGVDREIPTVTLELPEGTGEECWRAAGEGILAALLLAPAEGREGDRAPGSDG